MSVSLVLHRLVPQQPENFEDIRLADFEYLIRLISESQIHGTKNTDVMITFDDGHKSDIEFALPAIQKLKLVARFFIVPAWIGKPGYCSWSDIKSLSSAGMIIGSHSMTHPRLTQLSSVNLKKELIDSKNVIADRLGKEPEEFAIPFGDKNNSVINAIIESGYRYCYTSDHGTYHTGSQIIPRNSINARTPIEKYPELINPNFKTRILWSSEDYLKKILKILPDQLYRKIRNFAGGYRD